MPTYKRFEELPAWQSSAELFARVDDLLDRVPPLLRHSFREQLERAALSVSSNIAEGFERGTMKELLAFLHIARGSAGEVRSLLILGVRRPYLANFKPEIGELIRNAESCSRQLRAWTNSLQNSDIQGPRHLNEQIRAAFPQRQPQKAAVALRPEIPV